MCHYLFVIKNILLANFKKKIALNTMNTVEAKLKNNYIWIAVTDCIYSVLCALIFVIIPAKSTFLIYNFSYVTIMQVIWLVTEVNMFNVANLNQIKQHYQTEYFVIREMFLGIGKIIGTVLLVIISMFENIYLLNIFLLFLTIGMAIMNFYVVSLNKKL